MPRALSVETSGRIGSIALSDASGLIADEQFPHGLKHAAEIIPIIDRLCRSANWTPRDIEHLYLSAGPGSFTGLRIAVTLAKTISLTTGARLVAVPTARILVENAPADAHHVIIVLDAKRDQIYTARFERLHNEWIERQPAHLSFLPRMLRDAPRPVHLLGEGIPYHLKSIPSNDSSIIITPDESWRARAGIVARIGQAMAAQAHFTDPDHLAPIYIRPPEAEEKFNQRRQ
jgi:tRNA threonylcarbamoyladenosine biosynthesis protein TsaB